MSQLLTKSRTFWTRGLGTLSPKNITSGFKQSLWHLGQVAKVKRSTSSGLSSTLTSGRTCFSGVFKIPLSYWLIWFFIFSVKCLNCSYEILRHTFQKVLTNLNPHIASWRTCTSGWRRWTQSGRCGSIYFSYLSQMSQWLFETRCDIFWW